MVIVVVMVIMVNLARDVKKMTKVIMIFDCDISGGDGSDDNDVDNDNNGFGSGYEGDNDKI